MLEREQMSMEYCFICDKNIDTDYDVEHDHRDEEVREYDWREKDE